MSEPIIRCSARDRVALEGLLWGIEETRAGLGFPEIIGRCLWRWWDDEDLSGTCSWEWVTGGLSGSPYWQTPIPLKGLEGAWCSLLWEAQAKWRAEHPQPVVSFDAEFADQALVRATERQQKDTERRERAAALERQRAERERKRVAREARAQSAARRRRLLAIQRAAEARQRAEEQAVWTESRIHRVLEQVAEEKNPWVEAIERGMQSNRMPSEDVDGKWERAGELWGLEKLRHVLK